MGKAMLSQEKDFRFVSRICDDVRKALEPKVDRIAEVFVAEHYPITSPTHSVQGVQIDGEEYTFGDLPDTSFGDVVRVYDKTGASLFEIKHGALERLKASAEEEITAAEAAMKTEDKSVKDRAKEKLENELNTATDKALAEPVIYYLQKRISESESLASDICQEHKTWGKCRDYIYSKAREQSKGSTSCVRDDVVYEWAEDYYHLDDKAAEEEKAKKAAEQVRKDKEAAAKKRKEMKKKQQEEKAKPAVRKAAKPKPEKEDEKSAPVKKEEKPRKKSKELDGQMDFFSMLGM
ncbi:MAG: PcfK-like family protein [Clostridiales bacterium]|nr:PcfK-like family protein [Clostridiales bacterium]